MLERQKRLAQYRFQQEYLERRRQQQVYWRDHRFDYDRDPYFYTPPIYRYHRAGRYYDINEYGAKMLRQAVNYGYEEGFRAGGADFLGFMLVAPLGPTVTTVGVTTTKTVTRIAMPITATMVST